MGVAGGEMTQGKEMPHISTNPVEDFDYLTLNGIVFFKATPERKAAPELLEALQWALGVIETCEKSAHNIDWSIGHFGRKVRAQEVIAKATGGAA